MIGKFDQREPFCPTRHRQMLANDVRNAYSNFFRLVRTGAEAHVVQIAYVKVLKANELYRDAGYTDLEEVIESYISNAATIKIDEVLSGNEN